MSKFHVGEIAEALSTRSNIGWQECEILALPKDQEWITPWDGRLVSSHYYSIYVPSHESCYGDHFFMVPPERLRKLRPPEEPAMTKLKADIDSWTRKEEIA